jgi:signal transduction histidine kinase
MTDSLGDLHLSGRIANIAQRSTLGDPGVERAALTALIRTVGADGGRLYTLDLSTGRYESTSSKSRAKEEAFFDARLSRDRDRWGMLELALATKEVQGSSLPTTWREHSYASRIVIPIVRTNTVVGLVDLHWERPPAESIPFGSRLREIELATQQIANLFEARSVHRILERTAKFRVDLKVPYYVAMANLIRFVGESSGMQYAVLRRWDGDDGLACEQVFGFKTEDPPERLNFERVAVDYPAFAEVIRSHDHWIAPNLASPEYEMLKENGDLSDIKSFVACPVLIGDVLWGVLSFAAAVEYEYSPLEAYSLRALANLTGVALEALADADSAAEAHFGDGQLMQAVLSNEVVVATRHEMYDQLEIVGMARSVLSEVVRPLADPRHSSRLTKSDIELLLLQAEALDAAHGNMLKVLDTVKFAQSAPQATRERVSVLEIWARAAEPFAYRVSRLGLEDIAKQQISPRLAVAGSPDWVRIVFMHLILNGLDAFARRMSRPKKGSMSLRLVEDGPRRTKLRYYDNAGGILPNTLKRKGVAATEGPAKAVFERYVSSKEGGTGLGLASCRAAMELMGASIELVDWRSGVTFDLEFDSWTEN